MATFALVQNGGLSTIDAVNNTIEVAISDEEMAARRAVWTPPAYKFTRGWLYKYIKSVKPASAGCVTDE